ncbi:hypothetical protein REPUB_Repub06bG0202600 [Reevesia pubescens]
MAFELIILTVFTFIVLVMVIGFGCLVRYGKVSPSDATAGVHGFVGGGGFGRTGGGGGSGGGGDGGGGC